MRSSPCRWIVACRLHQNLGLKHPCWLAIVEITLTTVFFLQGLRGLQIWLYDRPPDSIDGEVHEVLAAEGMSAIAMRRQTADTLRLTEADYRVCYFRLLDLEQDMPVFNTTNPSKSLFIVECMLGMKQ
jgi:hypothetical protein